MSLDAEKNGAGNIALNGFVLLEQVPECIRVIKADGGSGVFLSSDFGPDGPIARFTVGRIANRLRFAACVKRTDSPFWTRPAAGGEYARIPEFSVWFAVTHEDGSFSMFVPLPLPVCAVYLGENGSGFLEAFAETGDSCVSASGGVFAYVSHGVCLRDMIAEGAAAVSGMMPSARLRRRKPVPGFADKFGWCTWNAFYGDVSEEKVRLGLSAMRDAGIPPRFVVLDDGWLSTEKISTGGDVLAAFEANSKFPGGLKAFTGRLRSDFGVEDVLVWHAADGYWKGVSQRKMGEFSPVPLNVYASGSFDLTFLNWQNGRVSWPPLGKYGAFYDAFHTFLENSGVSGVKVDNQASEAYLSDGAGGRIVHFREMRDALMRSVRRHFGGNMISCMAHVQEIWYNCRYDNMIRGSDDYFPDNPGSHIMHLWTNAMSGIWFGEFMWQDWDMFFSDHPAGAYHAAARAVSGSPLYVADAPGRYDARVIEAAVLPDGSVRRCDSPGRIAPDCLFHDPIAERIPLKVVNTFGEYGVEGVFSSCRPGGDSPPQSCVVRPSDAGRTRFAKYAAWFHCARKMQLLRRSECAVVEVASGGFEVVTFAPVHSWIALTGAVRMFVPAAGIADAEFSSEKAEFRVLRPGLMAAWCRECPESVMSGGGLPVRFEWDKDSNVLAFEVPEGAGSIVICRSRKYSGRRKKV